MTMRATGLALAAIGILVGTISDRVPAREPMVLGGYRVVAADFHTHSSTWSDSAVTPWGLVLEAQRQRLDAFAITGHRQTQDARWGRWFSEWIGGPVVLVGEELPEPRHHLIAVGIASTVDSSLPIASQIEEIHRQGGVAIAAHPGPPFFAGFAGVMDRLDGSEVCHPAAYTIPDAQQEFVEFASRTSGAAIGSSDFHGTGRIGLCRTFVFASDLSEKAILDAIRARRTVVYGVDGRAYGDPSMIALAESAPEIRASALPAGPSWDARVSQVAGISGLVLWLAGDRRRSNRLTAVPTGRDHTG